MMNPNGDSVWNNLPKEDHDKESMTFDEVKDYFDRTQMDKVELSVSEAYDVSLTLLKQAGPIMSTRALEITQGDNPKGMDMIGMLAVNMLGNLAIILSKQAHNDPVTAVEKLIEKLPTLKPDTIDSMKSLVSRTMERYDKETIENEALAEIPWTRWIATNIVGEAGKILGKELEPSKVENALKEIFLEHGPIRESAISQYASELSYILSKEDA